MHKLRTERSRNGWGSVVSLVSMNVGAKGRLVFINDRH